MYKKPMFVALLAAIGGALLLGALPGLVAAQEEDGFQPWGTWAWATHRPSGGTFPALITYHKEGTLSGSDGLMYGISYPPASISTRESGLHGVWERTGPHSFRGTSYWMNFAPETGNVISWGRARSDLHFVEGDPDHLEGTMFVDVLPCPTPFTCPDPVSTPVTSSVTVRAVSATRVARVEPPVM